MHCAHIGETAACICYGKGFFVLAPENEDGRVGLRWIEGDFLRRVYALEDTVARLGLRAEAVEDFHRLFHTDIGIPHIDI